MSKNKATIAVVVLALAGAAGFWAANSVEQSPSNIAQHMHENLDRITAIKALLISGHLDEAREHARWLAERELDDGMPAEWQPYLDSMRLNARAIVDADSLGSAATSVSEVARACGDCHWQSGFTIRFGFDQKPETEREDLSANMLRHMWAADRMWEGLIGPSDESWMRGTEILSEVSFDAVEEEIASAAAATGDEDAEVTAVDLLFHVQRLGALGATAGTREERSALYGDFLSRCAECHVLTGGGPAL